MRNSPYDIIASGSVRQDPVLEALEKVMASLPTFLFRSSERHAVRREASRTALRDWATRFGMMAVAIVIVIAVMTIIESSIHFLAPQEHAGAMILGAFGSTPIHPQVLS